LWQRKLRNLIVSQVATTLPKSAVADIEPEKGIEETVRSTARQAGCADDTKLIPA
jgi:hypothetical protein